MRQRDLRKLISEAIANRLFDYGLDELVECVAPEMLDVEFDLDPAIRKAMKSAYFTIQDGLRQMSRIGVRLELLEKQPDTSRRVAP